MCVQNIRILLTKRGGEEDKDVGFRGQRLLLVVVSFFWSLDSPIYPTSLASLGRKDQNLDEL